MSRTIISAHLVASFLVAVEAFAWQTARRYCSRSPELIVSRLSNSVHTEQTRTQNLAYVISVAMGLAVLTPSRASASPALMDRMGSNELRAPGLATFRSSKILYFPRWLQGSWECSLTLVDTQLPLGESFVPRRILRSLQSTNTNGTATIFEQRFYSTLPDTTENALRVTLGKLPTAAVVPDRAFNQRSMLDAYYGYPAVAHVDFDASKEPRRMTIEFSTTGPDMQPLGRRRQELFFQRLDAEDVQPGTFVTSELIRSATLGQSVSVTDSETLSKYSYQPDGSIEGMQRVALYLTPHPNSPEGIMWEKARGRSVAEFLYRFSMKRKGDCVLTPKGIEQCAGAEGPLYRMPESQSGDTEYES